MSIHISKTTKMPCHSWSLPALDTCPGSRDSAGQLVEVCQGCYATTGNYRFPSVRLARENNRHDWVRWGWVDDMVKAIGDAPYFRWFDSGDIYSAKLADKILEVIKRTPNCKHWIPTRSHKVAKLKPAISRLKKERNASVRYSADKIGRFNKAVHGSVVFAGEKPDNSFLCEAYTRGGECGDCRACWDTNIKTIAYPTHGANMNKVVRGLAA